MSHQSTTTTLSLSPALQAILDRVQPSLETVAEDTPMSTYQTICPECHAPGQAAIHRWDGTPAGRFSPEYTIACAACPACGRVYRIHTNLAPVCQEVRA